MLSSHEVANYLLSHHDAGRVPISNLKLQKLMYYAQGYHLAITGSPLFGEKIEAWEHGPVVSSVYHKYKNFGNTSIQGAPLFDSSNFQDSHLTVLDFIAEAYGDKSAWTLRNMTHCETPWMKHSVNGSADNQEITHAELLEFFSQKVPSGDYVEGFIASHQNMRVEAAIALPDEIDTPDDFSKWLKSL